MISKRKNNYFQENATISANSTEFYDFTSDRVKDDYTPFRNITIFNDNIDPIEIYINSNLKNPIYLQQYGVVTLEDVRVNTLSVKNLSATRDVDIVINLNNDYSQKELLRKIARVEL